MTLEPGETGGPPPLLSVEAWWLRRVLKRGSLPIGGSLQTKAEIEALTRRGLLFVRADLRRVALTREGHEALMVHDASERERVLGHLRDEGE